MQNFIQLSLLPIPIANPFISLRPESYKLAKKWKSWFSRFGRGFQLPM